MSEKPLSFRRSVLWVAATLLAFVASLLLGVPFWIKVVMFGCFLVTAIDSVLIYGKRRVGPPQRDGN